MKRALKEEQDGDDAALVEVQVSQAVLLLVVLRSTVAAKGSESPDCRCFVQAAVSRTAP
jgi:hypothetical protein